MPPQHPPFWPQHAPPIPHAGRSKDRDSPLPFVIAPAPPLISLFTLPPQSGQSAIGASDIFWRRSKWWLHAAHSYS
jgi:hypothetical protein